MGRSSHLSKHFTMATLSLLLSAILCTILVNGDKTSQGEDITIKFADPIDVANKLLYDLDQQIQLYILKQNLPNLASSSRTGHPVLTKENTDTKLMSKNAEGPESVGSTNSNHDENNIENLLGNLSELDKKLQATFHDLQGRRRYVLGAMIRQMQSTVRRIRTNVSRMQVQLTTIETVVTQVPQVRPNIQSNSTALEATTYNLATNKEIFIQIEDRISSVTKKINDIVTRLNHSLNVNSATLTDRPPLNPIVTLNSIIQNSGQSNRVGTLSKKP